MELKDSPVGEKNLRIKNNIFKREPQEFPDCCWVCIYWHRALRSCFEGIDAKTNIEPDNYCGEFLRIIKGQIEG